MKQPQSIQINIPQPCDEGWDRMTPNEQGRFCDSCQKCVVDLTEFSDKQLYEYITAHKGERVCGRINQWQLKRPIHMPHQPKSRLYKWMAAAGMAIALAAVQENSFARAPVAIVQTDNYQQEDDTTGNDSITISGTVVDENEEPVIFAVVEIYHNGVVAGGAVVDFDGRFVIKLLAAKDYAVRVRCLGYNEKTVEVPLENLNKGLLIKMEASNQVLEGELIYTEYNPPLIDKWHGGTQKTIKSYEIEKGAY